MTFNDKYFRRKDDNKNRIPDWAVNTIVISLIILISVAGVKLIDARKQLRAIERAVSGCERLNTRHLIIMPVQGCSEANPTALIGYKN